MPPDRVPPVAGEDYRDLPGIVAFIRGLCKADTSLESRLDPPVPTTGASGPNATRSPTRNGNSPLKSMAILPPPP
jgi:hypothetical protein